MACPSLTLVRAVVLLLSLPLPQTTFWAQFRRVDLEEEEEESMKEKEEVVAAPVDSAVAFHHYGSHHFPHRNTLLHPLPPH